MPNKQIAINLLRGKEKSFLDKFIIWALSFGRVVIIITEGIALMAFLYRFSLDAKLVDLHDKIKQQQTIVALAKANEDKYRNLQDRLTAASTLNSQAQDQIQIFFDLTTNIPQDFLISQITQTPASVKMKAQIFSLDAFSKYIAFLKQYKPVKNISVDSIENKPSSGQIITGITIELKSDTK